jgi:hypothetical protein
MKQNKINKIIIGVLIVLILVLGYRALTEQKRVDYYICYNQAISYDPTQAEQNAIRDYCKERID